jgi:steroid Delta-isomerase
MAQRSMDAVGRGAKAEWLELYADDAVIEDPVGPSMFDPEGRGHHGRAGLGSFWDLTIAPIERFRFVVHDSFANGDSCANIATFTTTLEDGSEADTEIVTVYKLAADGKVASMRAYWEFERTVASMRPGPGR